MSVVSNALFWQSVGKMFQNECVCYSTFSGHIEILVFRHIASLVSSCDNASIPTPTHYSFLHIVVIQMVARVAAAAAWSSSWFRWHLGGGLSISHSASDSLIWNVDELWWKVAAAPPSPPPAERLIKRGWAGIWPAGLIWQRERTFCYHWNLGTMAPLLYVQTQWHSHQQQRHITHAKQMQAGWLTLQTTDGLCQRSSSHFLFCTRT